MFEQGDLSNRQKGRWVLMLPSTNFTAKWELVSVLTEENANSWGFHFKINKKNICYSEKPC